MSKLSMPRAYLKYVGREEQGFFFVVFFLPLVNSEIYKSIRDKI